MAKKVREDELPTRTNANEDGTIIYEAFPEEGSPATSEAKWAIRKQELAGGWWVTTWADGNHDKDNVLDDYATLTYTEIPLFRNYNG
jgi:hypothetical protein